VTGFEETPTPTFLPSPDDPEGDTRTSTQSRQLRPHPEIPATGFFDATTTAPVRSEHTTAPPDIGSIIQSFLGTTVIPAVPSVHFERSEDGWEVVVPSPTRVHGPHMEISTDGFDQPTHAAPAPNNQPQITDEPVTSQPYVPVPVPAVTPPPAITQGGVTLHPVPVTSVRVTTVDGRPTTVDATVNYRYVVGSATLTPGSAPTTINNVVVALSLDPAGQTVLVADDLTTTLPAPAPARAAQASTAQNVQIATTLVDGTTQYIVAGQTLAPGVAITVGTVPISIGTAGASTVLVMGDMTTTLPAAVSGPTTTSRKMWGATPPSSVVTTPGVVPSSGPNNPSATTSSGERARMSWLFCVGGALFLGSFAF
jgi:hypothetical protein